MTETPGPEAEVEEPLAMSWSIGRVLTVVAILAMVGFWAWILSGAPARQNPDKLEDRAYAASLEDRCQDLRDDLAELPAAPDIETAAERADVLDEANVLVAAFIDDLEAGAPTEGDAGVTMQGWIADWRTYLDNREDFARRLRSDPDAQLLLEQSPLGDSVDKTIQIFSQVNEIDACDTPGDVG